MYRWIREFLLGGSTFAENEEYLEFRFRVLNVILIFGMISSSFFWIADDAGLNAIGHPHVLTMQIHLIVDLICFLTLHNRKHLYYLIGIPYSLFCYWVFISALIWVPQDELRILWFFSNLPATFLLLGTGIGLLATAASMGIVLWINPHLSVPYSANALATATMVFLFLGTLMYAYSKRSFSFYQRMIESNQKLKYMASHDFLTKVYNARTYYEICDRLIQVAQREKTPFAVLFIDLDHFKKINDTLGHEAGDIVLQKVALCLTQNIRKSDALGRIGGEEFSIFLPNTNLAGALLLGEKLRKSIEELSPIYQQAPIPITGSIGVAPSKSSHQCIGDIQKEADQAMYLAKKSGRNRVTTLD